VALVISEKLSDILGFDGIKDFKHIGDKQSTFVVKFAPDILGRRYHMFIYTDIVETQTVGSSLVPLLRMINIRGSEGYVISNIFQNPYYLPLSRDEIEVISILLCNELGEELPMDKGPVTRTLHFRKIKTN